MASVMALLGRAKTPLMDKLVEVALVTLKLVPLPVVNVSPVVLRLVLVALVAKRVVALPPQVLIFSHGIRGF